MFVNSAMSLLSLWTDVAPLIMIIGLIALYMYLSPAPNKEKDFLRVEEGTRYNSTHMLETILEHGTRTAHQRCP